MVQVVGRAEPHNLKVVHPTQDRVLTIREMARLQVGLACRGCRRGGWQVGPGGAGGDGTAAGGAPGGPGCAFEVTGRGHRGGQG